MILQTLNKSEIDDSFYDSALAYHQHGTRPSSLSYSQLRSFITKANKLIFENDKLHIYIKSKSLNLYHHKVELIPPRDRDRVLTEMYNDVSQTRNGRDSFFAKVAMKYGNISRRYVQDFLKKQVPYQLHLHQPREKTVRPESVSEVCEKFQIDLLDMTKFVGFNARKGWIVTCIDVFSKYAFVRMITTKKADKVLAALKDILDENFNLVGKDPVTIHSDNGSEFTARIYKDYLKDRGIKIFYGQTYAAQQQGTIERFNRTLKGLIFSYITTRQGLPYAERFYDRLADIVKNYNTSLHSSIKARPIDIHKSNRQNVKQVLLVQKKLKDFYSHNKDLEVLEPHDTVRIHILTESEERKNSKFAKKVVPQWSVEQFMVVRRYHLNNPSKKPKYKLRMIRDEGGNVVSRLVDRLYYRRDLLKVVI